MMNQSKINEANDLFGVLTIRVLYRIAQEFDDPKNTPVIWLEIFALLMYYKICPIADFVYDGKLKSYPENFKNTYTEIHDVMDILHTLVTSNNDKYIPKIRECIETLLNCQYPKEQNDLRLAFSIPENYNWFCSKTFYIYWTEFAEKYISKVTQNDFLCRMAKLALETCHLDFVEWSRTKMSHDVFISLVRKILLKIKNDNTRLYPKFLIDYIAKFTPCNIEEFNNII